MHSPADRLVYEKRKWEAKRRNRIRRKRLIFGRCIVAPALLSLVIFFFVKSCSSVNATAIKGTFIFNDSTYYEFDGGGQGYMSLSTTRYAYAYSISEDTLKLDFDNESVLDCECTFTS